MRTSLCCYSCTNVASSAAKEAVPSVGILQIIAVAAVILLSRRTVSVCTESATSCPCRGRKKAALLYVLTYTLGCFTKHWNNYHVLLMGRLFCGVATSLLYSAFESWLVAEHFKVGGGGEELTLQMRTLSTRSSADISRHPGTALLQTRCAACPHLHGSIA